MSSPPLDTKQFLIALLSVDLDIYNLKGLAQAKIIKKAVILFLLFNMPI